MKKLFSMLIKGFSIIKSLITFLITGYNSNFKIMKLSIEGPREEMINYLSKVFKTKDSDCYFQFAQKTSVIESVENITYLKYNGKTYDFKIYYFNKNYNNVCVEFKYNYNVYLYNLIVVTGIAAPLLSVFIESNNLNYLLLLTILQLIIIVVSNIIQRVDYIVLKRRFEFLEFLINSEKNNSID